MGKMSHITDLRSVTVCSEICGAGRGGFFFFGKLTWCEMIIKYRVDSFAV